jgi:hypothetical protein
MLQTVYDIIRRFSASTANSRLPVAIEVLIREMNCSPEAMRAILGHLVSLKLINISKTPHQSVRLTLLGLQLQGQTISFIV